jgi:replicative DNA helicase
MSGLLETIGQNLCDLETEQALIALIFADNRAVDQVGDLGPDDFADLNLGTVFREAVAKRADGHPVNPVTLRTELAGLRLEDGRTGFEMLQSLGYAGTLPQASDLVARIRDLAARLRAVELSESIAAQFADPRAPIADTALYGVRQLDEVLSVARPHIRTSANIDEIYVDVMTYLQGDGETVEITTGFRDLDLATRGWHRGQLAIICGRTSMGKTAVAISSALQTALAGKNILMFSLEMPKQDVATRILSDLVWSRDCPIPYSRMHPRLLSHIELERVVRAGMKFSGRNSRSMIKSA